MKARIVGLGQTEFSTNSGRSEMRLALEAITAAVADAGLELQDVDGFVRYTYDTNSEAALTTALGLQNVGYYGEVDFGGVNSMASVAQAAAAVEAGRAQCVVVYRALNARSGARFGRGERVLAAQGEYAVASARESLGDIYGAPFGLVAPPQFHALYARRYFHEYGLSDERGADMLAAIAVSQREYANRNPRALTRDKPLTRDQYMNSRMLASPLRIFDFCLETDGAMAIIVASPAVARRSRQPSVEILAGSQHIYPGSAPMFLYARDMHSFVPPKVGDQLFARAGVTRDDIDVAGIYDATSILVPVVLEDFGFVGRGAAYDFLTSGQNRIDGALPINTHGGLLSEGYFHGLNTIAEMVRQLRGASANQVRDAQVAFLTVRGASSLILGKS